MKRSPINEISLKTIGMTKSPPVIRHENPSTAGWMAHIIIGLVLVVLLIVCGYYWLVPIEVIEQWAFDRAAEDSFEKFESVGKADFYVWLWRILAPIMAIVVLRIWWDLIRWQAFFFAACAGFAEITKVRPTHGSNQGASVADQIRTYACRGLLIGWVVLFVSHSIYGIALRAHDWPYFRFKSGADVLPNISESNRAVIRYLQKATPADARILIASDQKLFFLSYYLRPRTLLHRMHPGSEHVIPLKDQQRKLDAYQLGELTAEDLAQMPHDYTLEYFEHPDLVDRSHVQDDTGWVTFLRQHDRNPSLVPSYLVRLRKTGEDR